MNVATREVRVTECVSRERQRRFAGLELAIRAGLVEEPALQTKGALKELKRCLDVWDVDDGVAELHA